MTTTFPSLLPPSADRNLCGIATRPLSSIVCWKVPRNIATKRCGWPALPRTASQPQPPGLACRKLYEFPTWLPTSTTTTHRTPLCTSRSYRVKGFLLPSPYGAKRLETQGFLAREPAGPRGLRGSRKREPACKPDSVGPASGPWQPFIWAGGCPPARATSTRGPGTGHPPPYSVLLRVGFTKHRPLPASLVSSYLTVSPLPPP